MSNCSASSKMIYSQLTCVDTETLPDSEEFAFIACGDLQYSFTLPGGGCFCFHVCGPCARAGIFNQAFQAIYTLSSLLGCPVCPPTSEKKKKCPDLDMMAKITKLRFCREHLLFNLSPANTCGKNLAHAHKNSPLS